MARHAIVNKDTKKVVNVVVWEGAEWLPPRDHFVVQNDKVDLGDVWDEKTNTFTKFYDVPGYDPNKNPYAS